MKDVIHEMGRTIWDWIAVEEEAKSGRVVLGTDSPPQLASLSWLTYTGLI